MSELDILFKEEIIHIVDYEINRRIIKRFNFIYLFNFWERTPQKIIDSYYFSSTFACLDKAFVVGFALLEKNYSVFIRIDMIYHSNTIFGMHFSLLVNKSNICYSIDLRAIRNIITKGQLEQTYYSNLLLPINGNKTMRFEHYNTIELNQYDINICIGKKLEIVNWISYFRKTDFNILKFWPYYLSRFGKKIHAKIIRINENHNNKKNETYF